MDFILQIKNYSMYRLVYNLNIDNFAKIFEAVTMVYSSHCCKCLQNKCIPLDHVHIL